MNGLLKSCGPRWKNSIISFLIVGPAELSAVISTSLCSCAKERKWTISVHKAEAVADVLKHDDIELGVDFILFAFDCRVSQSILEVEENIQLLDEHYIVSGAACMVNCAGAVDFMGHTFLKLRQIENKYKLKFLCTNVSDNEACKHLANRILNLADGVLGITSGIPVATEF